MEATPPPEEFEYDPSADPKWSKKHIHFISWKHNKLEQAMTQIDAVKDDIISDLIFETIIDCCRSTQGYPDAPSVQSLTQNFPIIPPLPFDQLQFEVPEIRRTQKCPICQEQVDAPRFTAHLATCLTQTTDCEKILLQTMQASENPQ